MTNKNRVLFFSLYSNNTLDGQTRLWVVHTLGYIHYISIHQYMPKKIIPNRKRVFVKTWKRTKHWWIIEFIWKLVLWFLTSQQTKPRPRQNWMSFHEAAHSKTFKELCQDHFLFFFFFLFFFECEDWGIKNLRFSNGRLQCYPQILFWLTHSMLSSNEILNQNINTVNELPIRDWRRRCWGHSLRQQNSISMWWIERRGICSAF